MKITPDLFQAFLKCPTKCWLRATNEQSSGDTYAEWVKTRNESYRAAETDRLLAQTPPGDLALAPSVENLKTAKWRLAVDVVAQASSPAGSSSVPLPGQKSGETPGQLADGTSALPPNSALRTLHSDLESHLHAVERVPAEGWGKAARFIPIRFIFTNKLGKDDKLLLAFDAFVLSEALGRDIAAGKIIHGDDHATLKVKTSTLTGEVRKRLEKIAALLSGRTNAGSADSHVRESELSGGETRGLGDPRSGATPPDLVLSRHCTECEFQTRCRQIAVQKDDLSLLAGMSAKERQKLRSKGIFTVTQLSYTFRPRRRPKRMRDKREKYHHSLKALAIREKKIHIVGSPELKIEGTPVYLDVEGLPDRDFYYLIGLRIGNGDSAVQHSLWADTVEDEGKIWREFLAILETVEKPVLIHYGSYETDFLKRMRDRYGGCATDSFIFAKAGQASLNILSFVFGRIYFPTFSNGLKDIARFVGFEWLDPHAAGTKAISLRHDWETSGLTRAKAALITYNAEDCTALQRIVEFLSCFYSNRDAKTADEGGQSVVSADNLPQEGFGYFGPNRFLFPELEEINRAAYWDYQREKVLVKTNKQRRAAQRKCTQRIAQPRANKIVEWPGPPVCPKCGEMKIYKHVASRKTVLDLRFSTSGVKRWVTRYYFYRYRCTHCHAVVHNPDRLWSSEKFGRNLRALAVYQIVELRLPQETVAALLNQLFGFNLCRGTANKFKVAAAEFYQPTYEGLLKRITAGRLVHADETKVDFKSRRGYIWTFTNLDEVAFVFAESREGDTVQSVLGNFKGVLVSDFYAAYDSIKCPQQKCLIHLIRDFNDDLMAEPFNEELKKLIADFTHLVRPMIATVDRYGLRARFLHKHKSEAGRFYEKLHDLDLQSETARKCKMRLEKNQSSLFTFLDYDGVPWNNNNAEHAIKSFALLRRVITGVTTEQGIREYLVLLSVCQTCKYMGVDFLDFLRSGEKDIHAFAESRRRHGRRSPTSEPKAPPAHEAADK